VTEFVSYLLGGVTSGIVYALMALALVLIYRSSGVVNFAQVGQATITCYVALTVQLRTGSWTLGLAAALLAGLVLGALVQFVVLRPVRRADPAGALIATFGVLIALQGIAGLVWTGEFRAFPQPFPDTPLTVAGTSLPFSVYNLVTLIAAGILVIALAWLFNRTDVGLAMRASAFNPEVARLSGVRVGRMIALGWALAGLVGALAGVLVAPLTLLSPTSFTILLVFAFTVAVVGGLESPVGAVVVGIFTGLVLSLVTGYTDSTNTPLVALALLVISLILKPEGAFGHRSTREV